MSSETPMMAQYRQIKAKYPDAILFFRLGDFYEMFFDDAILGAQLLQITLTARSKGENKMPMCGVPYHSANNYISKLTKLGKKVAICEQLSDPNLPGIVQRDVIRVITPGTTLDENILDQKQNNFVLAVIEQELEFFSLSYADITTGEFKTTEIKGIKNLLTEVERIAPAEIIYAEKNADNFLSKLKNNFSKVFFFPFESTADNSTVFLMEYLAATQKTKLNHINNVQAYSVDDYMPLDEATLKNLELVSTLRENKKEGSLLWVLDKTVTSMGGRLMRFILTHPVLNELEINLRLNAVEKFVTRQDLLGKGIEELGNILDLQRILAKLSLNHGNARDLIGLKNSLLKIPEIKKMVSEIADDNNCLSRILSELDELNDLIALIGKSILDEPSALTSEGGMIKDGFNTELDELRIISKEGKSFIQALEREEIERTGIGNLKIRYNSVFGYYIEVSKGQSKNVPEDFIRKQTLVNAERFITPKLKEFEEKVLGAEEKIIKIEQKIFQDIRTEVVSLGERIKKTAEAIAWLDVVCSLAYVALKNNFCKPKISNDDEIKIVAGRHPVIEEVNGSLSFVANDCVLNNEQRLMLITGPNMGGKSTFLRQIALITLMAQVGSFVPAKEANIGIVDRIFTRVGASDNLMRGQSTFMVEMQETANILSAATAKSLVILDEIGRGTSTYDGMSIAWAIMEYIHDKIGAKTLFATHYHELIALAEKLPAAANYCVAVKEDREDGVVFLYKILAGGVDRSYGIEVAKLAGLPDEVIAKSKRILTDLEEGVLEAGINQEITATRGTSVEGQTQLFDTEEMARKHRALNEIEALDLNSLTPMQALQKLDELKTKLKD